MPPRGEQWRVIIFNRHSPDGRRSEFLPRFEFSHKAEPLPLKIDRSLFLTRLAQMRVGVPWLSNPGGMRQRFQRAKRLDRQRSGGQIAGEALARVTT
jgi:hypothetical protein